MHPQILNQAFQYACIMDVAALKPGNVGWHGSDRGMTSCDFMHSAMACGKILCASNQTLGQRIFNAVQRTQQAVGHNTNLGIILLCAPLIEAALKAKAHEVQNLVKFRRLVQEVLETATAQDTAEIFSAIRLAQPGGMGQLEKNDIANEPQGHLLDIMRQASDRDQIAAEYSTAYSLTFEVLMPLLVDIYSRWGYYCWTMTGIYLQMLGNYPDTLIRRKHGQGIAHATMDKLKPFVQVFTQSRRPQSFEQDLILLDRDLKKQGINPGTTADLAVNVFFIACFGKFLHESADCL